MDSSGFFIRLKNDYKQIEKFLPVVLDDSLKQKIHVTDVDPTVKLLRVGINKKSQTIINPTPREQKSLFISFDIRDGEKFVGFHGLYTVDWFGLKHIT